MAESITWSDSYIVGIDEIDQQHKYLFGLIDESIQCKEEKKLQLCLIRLYEYTKEHFKAEEHIMKIIGYSNYEQHQEQHSLLIKKLKKIFKEDIQRRY